MIDQTQPIIPTMPPVVPPPSSQRSPLFAIIALILLVILGVFVYFSTQKDVSPHPANPHNLNHSHRHASPGYWSHDDIFQWRSPLFKKLTYYPASPSKFTRAPGSRIRRGGDV